MNPPSRPAPADLPAGSRRKKASKQPGALRSQVWLTVQTRQAHQLIHGREGAPDRAPIIGLVGFAERLRVIWQAAREDDPWADWWLIKVCDAMDAAGDCIRNWKQDLDSLLQQQADGLEVSLAESLRPSRMLLQFASPYAYQGARLLAEYDALVCRVLTASHVGLVDGCMRDELLDSCSHRLRATFMIPQTFRLTGVDREAVRGNRDECRRAREAMGEVPEEILRGERRAPVVPRRTAVSGIPSANGAGAARVPREPVQGAGEDGMEPDAPLAA